MKILTGIYRAIKSQLNGLSRYSINSDTYIDSSGDS